MEPLIPSWANPGCWRHLCVPFKPVNSRLGIASLYPHPSQPPEEIPGVLAVLYDRGAGGHLHPGARATTQRILVQNLSDVQIKEMPCQVPVRTRDRRRAHPTVARVLYPNETGAHKGNRPGAETQAPAPSHGVTPRSTWQGQREPLPGSAQRPGGTGTFLGISLASPAFAGQGLPPAFPTRAGSPGTRLSSSGCSQIPFPAMVSAQRSDRPIPLARARGDACLRKPPQGQKIGTPESSLGRKKRSKAQASSERG